MPSDLDTAILKHRIALAKREAASRAVMRNAYRTAMRALQNDLRAMQTRLAEIQATGAPPPAWRLFEEARIKQLIANTEIQFQHFSDRARADIIQRQRDAIQQAQDDARTALETAFGPLPPGVSIPIASVGAAAVQQMVAVIQPDAPVGKLLNEFAGDAAQVVKDALTSGMINGSSPRVVARSIANRLGGEHTQSLLTRSFLISRTEMLRAYRNSTVAFYDANKHLLHGWRWSSAQDSRTCPVCWAMDGRIFPTEDKMATHPGCRCSLSPVPKTFKELGYDVGDEPSFTPQTGPERFAQLSASERAAILGPAAHAAYQSGEIDLSDLVGITRSHIWGTGRRRIDLATAKRRAKRVA